MRTITKNYLDKKITLEQIKDWTDRGLVSSEAYYEAKNTMAMNLWDMFLRKVSSMNVSQESF